MGLAGWQEIIIIAFLVIIFFGGRKLPEFARSLGVALNEFRASVAGETEEKKTPAKKKRTKKKTKKSSR